MSSFGEPDEDDCPAEHRRGRDIYNRISDGLRKEFEAGGHPINFADELQKRIDALPPDDRKAVDAYLKALSADKGPGFHEGGAH